MKSKKFIEKYIIGKILCNKQKKGQNELKFDLNNMHLNNRKS